MPGLLQTGGGSMGVKIPTPKLWEAPAQPTPHDHSVSHAVPSCGAVRSKAAEVQGDTFPETDHGQAGLAVYQLIEAETNFLYWEIFMEACYSCNGWIELNDGDVVSFNFWPARSAHLVVGMPRCVYPSRGSSCVNALLVFLATPLRTCHARSFTHCRV